MQRVAQRSLAEANLCMRRMGRFDDWDGASENEKESQSNDAMYE